MESVVVNPPECRSCGSPLRHTFVDLGMSPIANSYLRPEQVNKAEPFYPLHARVCGECFLVQLEQFGCPENIFSDYAYFSSYSESWLEHARAYAESAAERFHLGKNSLVLEVASNDGYLLQFFQGKGIPVLGVEPAQNVAQAAQKRGIRTVSSFLGSKTARGLRDAGEAADLVVANNVLAHVPDLRDFVTGLKLVLKQGGTVTLEFPHLLKLIEGNQFDTIYHEHFSYFSFCTAENVLRQWGLTVFDVEELSTHGGSLRLYARHSQGASLPLESRVKDLRERELAAGIQKLDTYCRFAENARETKRALLELLISLKRDAKTVVGYGAPAKGNTLLNYCGIGRDFLDYTVDISPHKQGRFLPGTHIPIHSPEMIFRTRPDYVLMLPWNLREEIMQQMAGIRKWGGQFILPIPRAEVAE